VPQIRHASWTGYIPKDEPPAVAEAWRAAADAASNAMWAEETLHDAKITQEHRDALYASLRALRKLGAINLNTKGRASGRSASLASTIFTMGERHERHRKANVPISGLGFARPDF
jgi:hypothetical protein